MSQSTTLVLAGSLGAVGVALADDPEPVVRPEPNKGERTVQRPEKPRRDEKRPARHPGETHVTSSKLA